MSRTFCPAEPKDGERILEILESSPAKGSIELLYTRRPDAYLSYQMESDEAYVFVAKEQEQIIGTVAELIHPMYLGGKAKKVAYICGLKKDVHYPGTVPWGKAFFQGLVKEDIDCYFCSVVHDNTAIRRLFEKKRRKTANAFPLQRYTTYMLAPCFHFKLKDNNYEFKRAEPADEQELLAFLNREGSKKDFFPVIDRIDRFTDLHIEDFYLLKRGTAILAAGALWDQSAYRQYIVKQYHGIMKLARCFNPLLRMLGYISLPGENEPIRFPMLSFFLSQNDNEEYYKAFLNHIVKEIKKKYPMFVIGTTASYFADSLYRKLKSIHFDTELYTIEFLLGNGNRQEIDQTRLWLECGLL